MKKKRGHNEIIGMINNAKERERSKNVSERL